MLTRFALANPMLTLAIALVALLAGPIGFLSHPSREDPKITIREASVRVEFPGLSAAKLEQLITQPLEEKIREIAEVKDIISTSSTGRSLISVVIQDEYTDLDPIWSDLRDKMEEIAPTLPEGAQGPFVDTDRGDVAMATIAVRGDGFENGELHGLAKQMRRRLYAEVPGVRKVTFYGVIEQQLFIEFDNVRLAQLGLDPAEIIQSVQDQNVIQPGGQIQADGQTLTIQPTGDFTDLEDLRRLPIAVPGADGRSLYLGDIATIRLGYQDPPGPHAFFNGKPAIIVGVSMIDGFDAGAFSKAFLTFLDGARTAMPVGVFLDIVTYQPEAIEAAVFGVMNNLWQTVLIVLAVVMAFLGFRTGLLVGAQAPLVMVATVLLMRVLGIDLERMSLAALIISLGLLVDNGIVIAEDLRNRIGRGEDRIQAARAVGASLSGPLLASSLTTIFAFMPLMLMPGAAGEYTRSISLVLAIALLVSWALAMTLLILACIWFLKPPEPVKVRSGTGRAAAAGARLTRNYRRTLENLVAWRWVVVPVSFATIALGAILFASVSKTFFPASDRAQLQVIVELPVGANAYATQAVVKRLSAWLTDPEINPEVLGTAAYVATGGPRFYLALSPIDGFPNKGYFIVSLTGRAAVLPLAQRIREFAAAAIPEARITPEVMSFGPGKAGAVAYEVLGPDADVLTDVGEQLKRALRAVPGARDVKDDWENPSVTIRVVIDQEKARRSGITSADVANALNAQLTGAQISAYRVGDLSIPVIVRTTGEARGNLDRLRTLNIARAGGAPVPLLQIAAFEGAPNFARIKRENLERMLTVTASHVSLTAAAYTEALAPVLDDIRASLPRGYRLQAGGEIADSADANAKLTANMPLALALIVLTLIWQFNSFVRPLLIIAVIPLTLTGVGLALTIAPGANFGFMAILGFLALTGIVINNAIVLIDAIDRERENGLSLHEAVVEAGVRRLRPIVMTTCTTALGLAPIIVAKDVLFYDLALVIAGGLIFGTLLTLIVIPCLAAIAFGFRSPRPG